MYSRSWLIAALVVLDRWGAAPSQHKLDDPNVILRADVSESAKRPTRATPTSP